MNILKFNSVLLVVLIFSFTSLESSSISYQTPQNNHTEQFLTFEGDSRTYILKKNITLGHSGLKNYKITFVVINLNSDNSVVTVSRNEPYSNSTTSFNQGFSLNSCHVSFLSKSMYTSNFWYNYAIVNSFYTNEANFRNISLNGDHLVITSKNDNFGAWMCYVGNEFIQRWNWKTGWLEYLFLTDYLVNGSINYQYEYELVKPGFDYSPFGIVLILPLALGIFLTVEFINYHRFKNHIQSKNERSFKKYINRKWFHRKKRTTKRAVSNEIFEKIKIIESENKP